MDILHQLQQSEAFPRAEVVFPLFELGNDFSVGSHDVPFIQAVGFLGSFKNVADFAGELVFGNAFLMGSRQAVSNWQQDSLVVKSIYPLPKFFMRFTPGDQMQMPRYYSLALYMCYIAHVDVICWFKHPHVGQSPHSPTQGPNEPRNVDILLLVRLATPAVTESDQEHWAIRLRFMSPQVKVIGQLFAYQLSPSDSGFWIDCA
jgi:hypothetical protein